MCLIAWNWQPGSATPLLLLSNRDEFYARAAQPLHWWEASAEQAGKVSSVLAGKDLQAGGTWLGVSRGGRLAALTNVRSAVPQRTDAPSRGELVAAFLQSDATAEDFLRQIAGHARDYNPFNLLVCDGRQLLGLHSRSAGIQTMPAGVGGVSNAAFHTPWPKLTQLRQRLQTQIDQAQTNAEQLLPLLHDRTLAPDEQLPDTGVPRELERALSAAFIVTPHYGTRACSVVTLHQDRAEFTEQSFDYQGLIGQQQQAFALE